MGLGVEEMAVSAALISVHNKNFSAFEGKKCPNTQA